MISKKIKKTIAVMLSVVSVFALTGCYYEDTTVAHPTNTTTMKSDDPYYYNDQKGLEIKLHEFVEDNTSCWLAIVKDSSDTSRIGRAVNSLDFPQEGDKAGKLDMLTMAKDKNAILAINASSFTTDETNGKAVCDYMTIHNGNIVSDDYIYGGTLSIDKSGHLDFPAYNTNLAAVYCRSSEATKKSYTNADNAIVSHIIAANNNNKGDASTKKYLSIYNPKTENPMITSRDLVKNGVTETIDFGNSVPLVVNGEKTDLSKTGYESYGFGENGFDTNLHPRTVIAQTAKKGENNSTFNEYVILVTDGRNVPEFTNAATNADPDTLPKSQGVNFQQLQDILYNHINEYSSKTILTAYNLDGGGSTQLCFKGRVLNHPCEEDFGGPVTSMRSVGDIIYFK